MSTHSVNPSSDTRGVSAPHLLSTLLRPIEIPKINQETWKKLFDRTLEPAEQLRLMILAGVRGFEPGTHSSEKMVGEALSCKSKWYVREAIKGAQDYGLLFVRPKAGTEVTTIDFELLKEALATHYFLGVSCRARESSNQVLEYRNGNRILTAMLNINLDEQRYIAKAFEDNSKLKNDSSDSELEVSIALARFAQLCADFHVGIGQLGHRSGPVLDGMRRMQLIILHALSRDQKISDLALHTEDNAAILKALPEGSDSRRMAYLTYINNRARNWTDKYSDIIQDIGGQIEGLANDFSKQG